jgi:hypothetical protein
LNTIFNIWIFQFIHQSRCVEYRVIRVLIAYLALLFIVPTLSAVFPLVLVLIPKRRESYVALKFIMALAQAVLAVFCSVKIFQWLGVAVTIVTGIVLLGWFLLNDASRVRRAEGALRLLRFTDLLGDGIGVIVGFLWLRPTG